MSGYCGWLRRPPSERSIRHAWLSGVIGEIHAGSRQTCGAKRVHAELVGGRGVAVCRKAVETLMRRGGLRGISGRPKWRNTANIATAADLVDRDFARDEPDRLWATDITEHPTREGKIYCAVVPGQVQPPSRGLADRLAAHRVDGRQRAGHGDRQPQPRGRRDGDPAATTAPSPPPGRSRSERSTRGCCRPWVQSRTASTVSMMGFAAWLVSDPCLRLAVVPRR